MLPMSEGRAAANPGRFGETGGIPGQAPGVVEGLGFVIALHFARIEEAGDEGDLLFQGIGLVARAVIAISMVCPSMAATKA